jgi:hypothetical protein
VEVSVLVEREAIEEASEVVEVEVEAEDVAVDAEKKIARNGSLLRSLVVWSETARSNHSSTSTYSPYPSRSTRSSTSFSVQILRMKF